MSSIISSLNLNGKSDYEKVQAIYKYLTDNVTYDNTHGSDYRLMFTAYGALIDGTSVCQGYASAFYRLCLYEGIDARILASKDHAWNIVEIGGAYYLLDATWDAYENVQGNWRYFLKGSRYWKTFHDNDNYTLGNLDHWQSKEPVENCYYIPAADYTITKPVITSHPQSVTAANGKNVSFKVSATGSELRYQWQYRSSAGGSWVNSGAPGNKTATLSFAPTYQNGYQYRCIVSNSAGTVYSNAATLTVKITAPKINSHPQSTSVAYGADVTFKVAAFGGNLRYQWQFRSSAGGSWVNSGAPGNKTASLSFSPTFQSGYQYRCVVSNAAGTVYSDPATLTVIPVITEQPQSVSAAYGAQVSFKVTASGSKLSYQWQYRSSSGGSWVNSGAPGSKTATLSFAPTFQNGYQYRCVVSSGTGAVTSDAATLTVDAVSPAITGQPRSTSVDYGANVSFKVAASGGSLSYQWQFRSSANGNWVNSGAPGSKTATLSFAPTFQNGYQYRCIVRNSAGSVTSDPATLTVRPVTPTITSHPRSTSVDYGANVSFKVAASGGSLSYQWQYRSSADGNWVNSGAPGNKTATLSFAPTYQDGYQYRCIVRNSAGTVNSDPATLTVIPVTPKITSHPQPATVESGANVTFKVTASGGSLSYQWQYRSSADGSWVNSAEPESKTASFSFTPVYQNGYQYRCIVSNSAGTVNSDPATLTVNAISGTFNGSPAQVDVTGNLLINDVNFPDANFRSYISDRYYSKSGYMTEARVAATTSIHCNGMRISSLKGIEYFTALTNLCCYDNKLTTLDVSHNTALTTLDCYNNQLTTLDVSHNTLLADLCCSGNQLTTLDVSCNTALWRVACYDNQLTALDVSNNTKLRELDCSGNQLTTLDVSHNTKLEVFYCESNQLTTLDLSNNTKLQYLHCYNNQLTTLDLSSNSKLSTLICEDQSPTVECSVQDGKYIMNLSKLVGAGNLSKVSSVTGGSYDSATGIVTLDAGNTKVTYNYNTGAPVSPNTMQVIVNGT